MSWVSVNERLPTAEDGPVIWRYEGCSGDWWVETGNEGAAVAWMSVSHLPPYTPPEPVKPKRQRGIIGVTKHGPNPPDYYHTDLTIRRGETLNVVEVLPGDLDPDDAAAKIEELEDRVAYLERLGTSGCCVHCNEVIDVKRVEHWEKCPKHPARARIQAAEEVAASLECMVTRCIQTNEPLYLFEVSTLAAKLRGEA